MIVRKPFFDSIRASLFGGTFTVEQVNGIDAILDAWDCTANMHDDRWLAYMCATAYWETNRTMQAVKEAYWLSEDWRRANLRYYPFYGRGLVQLTWEENYRKMGTLLGVDLVNNPDMALELPIAVSIMFEGMLKAESKLGDFTGQSLEMYFNDTVDDPRGARRIINGLDKADEIAAIYQKFLTALRAKES